MTKIGELTVQNHVLMRLTTLNIKEPVSIHGLSKLLGYEHPDASVRKLLIFLIDIDVLKFAEQRTGWNYYSLNRRKLVKWIYDTPMWKDFYDMAVKSGGIVLPL
jgi:hypothetical protein